MELHKQDKLPHVICLFVCCCISAAPWFMSDPTAAREEAVLDCVTSRPVHMNEIDHCTVLGPCSTRHMTPTSLLVYVERSLYI